MKTLILQTLASGMALVLVGCMHTVMGGNPVRSPDGRFKVAVATHGAAGRAFVDKTRKRVYVWLGPESKDSGMPALKQKYVFVAADLQTRVRWSVSEEVSINLFDYGDGVSFEMWRVAPPSNHIGLLRFRLTENGQFVQIE